MLNVYPTIITSLSDIFSTLQENKMVEIGFTFVIKLKEKKKKKTNTYKIIWPVVLSSDPSNIFYRKYPTFDLS